MTEQYYHGVEVIEIDNGERPIRTVKSSVIGIVGTAPGANAEQFPLNTPVLIAGKRTEAVGLGATGTLLQAVDAIFNQAGAMIVVVRVDADNDDATQMTNIVGGIDSETGHYQGVHALLASESVLGVTPRLLIAPGFSQHATVVNAFITIAQRLRAVIIADGPNTNDADAITYRQQFSSARVYLVDPHLWVFDKQTQTEVAQSASASVAGLIAKVDHDKGFWCSPSNHVINGVVGTARPIDFALGDINARANHLNEHDIATIIHMNGFRLWGDRTCSNDAKWAFLSVRRTADMIHESLLKAHLWAVDRNISKTYIEEVSEAVKSYLRHLKHVGAIINGDCWADPTLNTPEQIADGKICFDFDFTPPYPAEHITFRSHLVKDYLTEVLPN